MTTLKKLILGLCALLAPSFNRAGAFLRTTMLWVLLLPYAAFVVGFASNQAVLIANHDNFPVMVNEMMRVHFEPDANGLMDKEGHCVMTKDTHLNALADIFHVGDSYVSIGDYFLDAYTWLNGFCIYVWVVLVVNSLVRRRND